MNYIQLNKFADVVHYKMIELPYSASAVHFTPEINPKLLSHFHKDLEVIHVLRGDMIMAIGQERLHLEAGDTLIINANQPHHCVPCHKDSCLYNCLLFKADFLSGNELLYHKYIEPVIKNQNMPFLFMKGGTAPANRVALIVDRIAALFKENDPTRDLDVMGELCFFFSGLYSYTRNEPKEPLSLIDKRLPDDEDFRHMLAFMKQHFSEKIKLEDIAESAHIGRSKCCRLFNLYTEQTPMAFLNFYRLEISCNMLTDSKDTISSISKSCGFPNQSYYNKIFLSYYHVTPKEYRRRHSHLLKKEA